MAQVMLPREWMLEQCVKLFGGRQKLIQHLTDQDKRAQNMTSIRDHVSNL